MTKLAETIERLYATFAPYRVGDDFVGCDCCVSPEESGELASRPVRELTYEDLEHYSRSAMSTWGDVRHFKHFLPRLMELAVEYRDEFLDLAVVFGKLRYAQWQAWPPTEVNRVDEYLREYWAYQLSLDLDSPHSDAIDTVLCAEGCALESVEPLLSAWLAEDSISAKKHLAAFVLCNDDYLLRKHRLANAFWDDRTVPHEEVLLWLRLPEVAEYLASGELPDEFAPAAHQLETVQAALAEAAT
ncbi:hypothetical protein Mal64_27140 [Pseudobythopirellula maris]|uniref:Uncharacterized protein n=1 Tax=Pseudobythopirellula maris TaxID=2527991 RepID=A0A5C5ZJ15_9BACT|nr:hypothetical protein [Pseudobythopirellula maris]TWT87178.1 hypothetical protein Mal64_27140 [Pseudobythopirellula maris]